MLRRHRPGQRVWTTLSPFDLGMNGDSWVLLSQDMIDDFNDRHVKPPVSMSETARRGFFKKPLIDFAKALRDA